jgi:hypothetical protein
LGAHNQTYGASFYVTGALSASQERTCPHSCKIDMHSYPHGNVFLCQGLDVFDIHFYPHDTTLAMF